MHAKGTPDARELNFCYGYLKDGNHRQRPLFASTAMRTSTPAAFSGPTSRARILRWNSRCFTVDAYL